MEDPGPILLSLTLIVFLIFINATFVAAEFAFARLRKTQVDAIVESNVGGFRESAARHLQKILDELNDYVSTCQVGITIASLALGAIAEAQIEELISPWLKTLPYDLDVHVISITLAVIIITYFHVVLGEVVPKSLALTKPESVGLALAHYTWFIHTVFRVPVMLLNGSSNLCLRLFGIEPVFGEVVHSEDEIKRILSTSQEEGILEEDEEEIIQNVFDFNDTVAKEVMVPRTDMSCFSDDMTIEDAAREIKNLCYTRYPLYHERLDNITGYVTIKDILESYAEGKTGDTLTSIRNSIIKVPDGIYIIDLLKDMQRKKKQIAVLIDEFGGTSGLVTSEDIVEEIFGELQDEDEDEDEAEPIKHLKNGDIIVDGLVTLKDLNDELGTDFDSEHYDTIGGFVFGLIGADPKPGDRVVHGGYTLVVEKHSKQRVRSVRVVNRQKPI